MLVSEFPHVTVFSDRCESQEAVDGLLARRRPPERPAGSAATTGADAGADAGGDVTDVAVLAYGGALGQDSVRCVERLSRSYRVLVILPANASGHVLALLHAGALGVVQADPDEQEFFEALSVVGRGAVYVSAAGRRELTGDVGREPGMRHVLTSREQEVLRWIANGYTHSQAARRMGLSGATVDTYVKRIRAKLDVRNKAELTRKAVELGVVETPRPMAQDGYAVAPGDGSVTVKQHPPEMLRTAVSP